METITKGRELTLNDRCDSCTAAAVVSVSFLNGELMFCGHHARKIKDGLISKSISVHDPKGVLLALTDIDS